MEDHISIRKKYFNEIDNDILYHYTSLPALHQIISSQRMWATSINTLNDTTEINFFKDKFLQKIQLENQYGSENGKYLNILRRSYENLISSLKNIIFIMSFSLSQDSIGMWNQYGKNDGYSIGFKRREFLSLFTESDPIMDGNDKNEISDCSVSVFEGKVLYGKKNVENLINDYSALYLTESAKYIARNISEKIFSDFYENIMLELIKSSCLIKDDSYENEEEFRIVFILSPNNLKKRQHITKFRASHGTLC